MLGRQDKEKSVVLKLQKNYNGNFLRFLNFFFINSEQLAEPVVYLEGMDNNTFLLASCN